MMDLQQCPRELLLLDLGGMVIDVGYLRRMLLLKLWGILRCSLIKLKSGGLPETLHNEQPKWPHQDLNGFHLCLPLPRTENGDSWMRSQMTLGENYIPG